MNAQSNPSALDPSRARALVYGYRSDVGRKREHNEDSCAALGRADLAARLDGLFVVADGMGGMGGGDVASSLVVQSVTQTVHEALQQPISGRLNTGGILLDALDRANADVQARRTARPELRRMGTTCVAALVADNRLTLVNVGDSRAYLLREGRLAQLTEDHSLVWEEMRAGRLTPEEAKRSQFRNQILRGVGLAASVEADLFTQTLRPGDTVLLCSDGLTTEVEETEIARILATAPSPQDASDLLVAAALQGGGSDNITVIVLRYGAFTPLTATEEESTDPDAEWRKAPPIPLEPPRAVRTSTPSHERPRPLVALLAVVALAEAVALGWLWQQAHHPPPALPITKPPAPTVRATDAPLTYGELHLIAKGPFRNDVLQILPNGDLLVATAKDTLVLLTPEGAQGPLLRNDGLHVATAAEPTPSSGKQKATAGRLDIAVDASGNRYQLLPGRGIDKFDAAGTQILAGLGKGAKKVKGLVAPTRIAVDGSGNLYVLDDHQLKRFDAHPKAAPTPAPGAPQ